MVVIKRQQNMLILVCLFHDPMINGYTKTYKTRQDNGEKRMQAQVPLHPYDNYSVRSSGSDAINYYAINFRSPGSEIT